MSTTTQRRNPARSWAVFGSTLAGNIIVAQHDLTAPQVFEVRHKVVTLGFTATVLNEARGPKIRGLEDLLDDYCILTTGRGAQLSTLTPWQRTQLEPSFNSQLIAALNVINEQHGYGRCDWGAPVLHINATAGISHAHHQGTESGEETTSGRRD